jgi:hypothetical protein
MLRKTNTQAFYCYERAAENRRMADQGPSNFRQVYLDLEQRWRKLALSYEFSDRLNRFTAHTTCAMDKGAEDLSPTPILI